MSKNISIQEGGVGRNMSVDKLRTALAGGGTCLWVPEDSVNLGTKSITEDGTYKAADDGLYGYSEVTVYGIGKVTGKGEDGNEYSVGVDENGDLTFTKLPSSIRITTNPEKMEYAPHEHMDYTGMVVTAYDENGDRMYDIPLAELILQDKAEGQASPTGARSADGKIEAVTLYTVYIGNAYIYPFPLGYRHHSSDGLDWPITVGSYAAYLPVAATLLATRFNGVTYMARIDGDVGDFHVSLWEQDPSTGVWHMYGGTSASIPYNQFSASGVSDFDGDIIPLSTASPTDYRPTDMEPTDITLTLPVGYARPQDGEILETTLTVTIITE